MDSPTPRFTGIFIPKEILEIEELTLFEMILLSWIDALYSEQHGGCFASNQYLGQKIKGSQENTVAKAITKLRKLGLVQDISFDGRTRVIKAQINRQVDAIQSKRGLDKNPMRVGQKSNANLDKNPSRSPLVLIDENKDYNKEREGATKSQTRTPISKVKKNETGKSAYRSNIFLTKEQYDKLLAQYGTNKLEWMLNFFEAKKGSMEYPYKSDYHVLLPANWVNKEYEKEHHGGKTSSHYKMNEELASRIWDKYKSRKEMDIELGYKYIEFKNGMTVTHVEFGQMDFEKICMSELKKRNLRL